MVSCNAHIPVEACNDLTPIEKRGGWGIADMLKGDISENINKFHHDLATSMLDMKKQEELLRCIFFGTPTGLTWKKRHGRGQGRDLVHLRNFFTDVSEGGGGMDDKIDLPNPTFAQDDEIMKWIEDNYLTFDDYVSVGKSYFEPVGKRLFTKHAMMGIWYKMIQEQEDDNHTLQDAKSRWTKTKEFENSVADTCSKVYSVDQSEGKTFQCGYDWQTSTCERAAARCDLNPNMLSIQGKIATVEHYRSEAFNVTLTNTQGVILSTPLPFLEQYDNKKRVWMAFAAESVDEQTKSTLSGHPSQSKAMEHGLFLLEQVPFDSLDKIEIVDPPVWEMLSRGADLSNLKLYTPVTDNQIKLLNHMNNSENELVFQRELWDSFEITDCMQDVYVVSGEQHYRTKPIQSIPWSLINVSLALSNMRGDGSLMLKTPLHVARNLFGFWDALDTNDASQKKIESDAEKGVSTILETARQSVMEKGHITGLNWEHVTTRRDFKATGRDLAKQMHASIIKQLRKHLWQHEGVLTEEIARNIPNRQNLSRVDYMYDMPNSEGYWKPIGDTNKEPHDQNYIECKNQLQELISNGHTTVHHNNKVLDVKVAPPAKAFIRNIYEIMRRNIGSADASGRVESKLKRNALSVLPIALQLIPKETNVDQDDDKLLKADVIDTDVPIVDSAPSVNNPTLPSESSSTSTLPHGQKSRSFDPHEAAKVKEYKFTQPPPGVSIPSMSTETHVTIRPRGNGLADVIVARPRSNAPPATQVRYTNEQGEYECAMRFDRKYKCWNKMSDLASVTLTAYRWIARNVVDYYKLRDKKALVVYHASHAPDSFPHDDRAHTVVVGAAETSLPIVKRLRAGQTGILVKTVCGANDKMPCVNSSCTLNNTECVQCKHGTFCGADESVLLSLVVWACETRPEPVRVELRGVPERLYELANWLCDISTSRADVMNFEKGVRAQLHIQRFIESVPLCLSSLSSHGVCYWFDPKPSSVSKWLHESTLSYVVPLPRLASGHALVSELISKDPLPPCVDTDLLGQTNCVLEKMLDLQQRIVNKREEALRYLKTQTRVTPTRLAELQRHANPQTDAEFTVHNVHELVRLYSEVGVEQLCEHLDDRDSDVLMHAIQNNTERELDNAKAQLLATIGSFLSQQRVAA